MSSSPVHIAFRRLLESFQKYPERVAIIERDGGTFTYRDLLERIVSARNQLVSKGVKKGSKVLVFVPMSMELYAILEALFSIGATAVFLDPWMKGKKMSAVIRQVKPDLFVVTKKINRIAWILPATWPLKKWVVDRIAPANGSWQIDPVSDTDNALITFTSGTSGVPKGANRTFAFLHAQAETLLSHMQSHDGQPYVDYTNFPIVGLADFAVGNTVVIPDLNLMKIHEADAVSIGIQLRVAGVNRVIVSPSLLSKIVLVTGNIHLREIITGGAPVSKTLIKNCLDRFPETRCEAIYGSTEAEPISLCGFHEILQQFAEPLKGVYVGRPVDAIRLKILQPSAGPVSTEQFQNMEVQSGQTGEVVVTGDHVNKYYFENEAAFQENKIVDADGTIWHRTGDIGYLDGETLYLVGRAHRIMTYNGKQIYPYPVEQYIEQRFGYTDTGYLQLPSKHFILFIGGSKPVDEEPIREALTEAGFPVDAIVFSVKPLPRDARHRSKLQTETLLSS